MAGATKDYKARLRTSVDEDTYRAIERVAVAVIRQLPNDVQLGVVAAGLMFAATAFAEGASHADRLITED